MGDPVPFEINNKRDCRRSRWGNQGNSRIACYGGDDRDHRPRTTSSRMKPGAIARCGASACSAILSMKLMLNDQASGSDSSRVVMDHATLLKPIVINLPVHCTAQRLCRPIRSVHVARSVKMPMDLQRKAGNRFVVRNQRECVRRGNIRNRNDQRARWPPTAATQ